MRKNVLNLNPTAYGLAALTLVAFTAPSFAQGGGASGAHMSTQGSVNSNGPNATDRDKGKARAQDRTSTKGEAHDKANAKDQTNTDTK